MYRKVNTVLGIALTGTFLLGRVQAQTLPDAAAETMRQIVAGGIVDDRWTMKADPSQLIEIARPYLENEYSNVRDKAVGWLALALNRAMKPKDRELAVNQLLVVASKSPKAELSELAIGYLARFSRHADFTDDNNKLLEQLMAGRSASKALAQTAGIAASERLIARLKELAQGVTPSGVVQIALARTGDREAAIRYAHQFEAMTKIDQILNMHTLAYTRSPEALELLKNLP